MESLSALRRYALGIAGAVLVSVMPARSDIIATFNWGTAIDTAFYNSYQDPPLFHYEEFDWTNSYATTTWELGAFVEGFTPTMSNIELWEANWIVFDVAFFFPGDDELGPIFAGEVDMLTGGVSSNTNNPLVSTNSFFDLDAYIWGYQGDKEYRLTLEWLVFRATNWVFPEPPEPDAPILEIEWTVFNDWTTNDIPLFGNIDGQIGLGLALNPIQSADPNFANVLQLYTLAIPEPGTFTVGAMLLGFVGYRIWRRRAHSGTTQTSV